MKVAVTGIGLVSALGISLETSWQRLILGESGLEIHQPFPALPPRPLGLIDRFPQDLTTLTHQGVSAALTDAQLHPPLRDCGVAIGSSRSYQGQWEKLTQTPQFLPNCLDFLPHMVAIQAARQIGATGLVAAPMAACATGLMAIAQAMLWIDRGDCQQAIAGGVESPITPLTLAGFQQMGALAQTGCYPFDRRREGFVLGEGAAVLVLESLESAQSRQARIYGYLRGFGFTTDAYHVSAPEPQARSAQLSVKQCLERSHFSVQEIDYIHAHGTSTPLNDRNEALLIQQLFPQGVAVSSTKGATGHPLGASGAMGVAFGFKALEQQCLPPCVGLKQPEFELDLVRTPRFGTVNRILCLSFGFGGQNAAIALSKL